MMLQKSLLIILSIISLTCYANEGELQRLFTTAEERTLINQQKYQARTQLSKIDRERPVALISITRISLDAVLIGSKKVVWVNRQQIDRPITVAGVVVDPKYASASGMWLVTVKGRKWLKQGQVYLTESGKVVERYEAI